jgi:hypothetical protein
MASWNKWRHSAEKTQHVFYSTRRNDYDVTRDVGDTCRYT